MSSSMGGNSSSSRVLVVGLDGASFDLLEPLLKDGLLPNLSKLLDEGTGGILESTIPPVTIPAWVSMLTGKNPGKLGCYDLLKRVGYLSEPNVFCYKGKIPIWHLLNKYGIRTGLMNIPGTYPPQKVNGFMITGMFTPSKRSDYSYPANLSRNLEKKIADYEIDVPQWQYFNDGHFIKDIYKVTEKRLEAALFLSKNISCDFFMVVFTSSDRIQHVLWNNYGVIKEYWTFLDQILGRLMQYFNDTNVFVVSDHGFGSLRHTFYINEWLKKNDYLQIKENYGYNIKLNLGRLIEKLYRFFKKNLKFFDPILSYLNKVVGLDNLRKLTYNYLSTERLEKLVLWKKSKAFAAIHSPHFGQIYLNVKGKMKKGCLNPNEIENIRDDIIKDLKTLRNPETGKLLKIDIFKPEDIYFGDYVNEAPNIIFILENGTIEVDATLGYGDVFKKGSPFTGWTGTHTKNGLFIAKGPSIKKNHRFKKASILDILPTILKIYGIPLPAEIDGKPMNEILRFVSHEKEAL
ncbi:MAG: alkaline phosphatase family protein, partial [Promethearchaeota archaeon]